MSAVSMKHVACWLLVVGLTAPVALAQVATSTAPATSTSVPQSFPPPPYYGYGGNGYGFGFPWGTTGTIGSTAAGSYLGGLGMAIRAQGQYNLMTSEAAINLQQAQRQALENQVLWTNTYFEKRRINRSYREAERGRRLTQADWVRMAQSAAPRRVDRDGLDPVTGQIAWPTALQADVFAQDRETLDHLFALRASTDGAVGVQTFQQIRTAVDDALARLKSHIRDIDTRRYLEARNFLTGLAREAEFPTG
jgi:hypothetical protein